MGLAAALRHLRAGLPKNTHHGSDPRPQGEEPCALPTELGGLLTLRFPPSNFRPIKTTKGASLQRLLRDPLRPLPKHSATGTRPWAARVGADSKLDYIALTRGAQQPPSGGVGGGAGRLAWPEEKPCSHLPLPSLSLVLVYRALAWQQYTQPGSNWRPSAC